MSVSSNQSLFHPVSHCYMRPEQLHEYVMVSSERSKIMISNRPTNFRRKIYSARLPRFLAYLATVHLSRPSV